MIAILDGTVFALVEFFHRPADGRHVARQLGIASELMAGRNSGFSVERKTNAGDESSVRLTDLLLVASLFPFLCFLRFFAAILSLISKRSAGRCASPIWKWILRCPSQPTRRSGRCSTEMCCCRQRPTPTDQPARVSRPFARGKFVRA